MYPTILKVMVSKKTKKNTSNKIVEKSGRLHTGTIKGIFVNLHWHKCARKRSRQQLQSRETSK